MDLPQLTSRLTELGLGHALDPGRPGDALAAVERAAEATPGDPNLARAALDVADWGALVRAPAVGCGVRRTALLRWDAHTVTWSGIDAVTGSGVQLRALRAHLAGSAPHARWLRRVGRALAQVLPVRANHGSLIVPQPGSPAAAPQPDHPIAGRWLATGLADLARYEGAGLGLPALLTDELRAHGAGWRAVCLTPSAGLAPAIASVAQLITGDGPVAEVARGLSALPPQTIDEAAAALRQAFAEALTNDRHALARRWRTGWRGAQRARLLAGVLRLERAVPPPAGRGAVGVDLDGQITVLSATADAITWGVTGSPEPVWSAAVGWQPARARHLLRARAASPPNARLDAAVDGDPASTERLYRWVSTGLRLRTVRLLLEKTRA